MRRAPLPAIVCACVLAACALKNPPPHDETVKQALPNLVPPAQWSAASVPADAVTDDWLAAIDEPALTVLVDEAMVHNVDLRTAAARVDTAAAYLAGAKAPLWPQVNLVARGGGKMSGDSSGLEGAGLFAAWELDLWGRVRATARATELQYDSTRLDAEYARQSIAAMVVKSWVVAVEARMQRMQLAAMLASSEKLVSLANDRLRVGYGDELEVALAQANVETLRDTARGVDLAHGNALRAIEALVGRYPSGAVAVASRLPVWTDDVPAGVPAELLERRPDVAAAERRVAAAFYRTEEAKAARLPRITLVANFTSLSSELFVLQSRENPLFSFGAGLVQPLFLGGLLQSQVEARTAEQQGAIADYGKVGARAFGEVEGALAARITAADRAQILARAVRENERALAFSNARYNVGSVDLRTVQQQQLSLYAAQNALLRMQADELVQRVNLHLALGGSFAAGATMTGDASATTR
jgi:NodT family efflux transporter outer membrane factor (OMF) lipoprotein